MADEKITIELDLDINESKTKKEFGKASDTAKRGGEKAGRNFAKGFQKNITGKIGKGLKNAILLPLKTIGGQLAAIGVAIGTGFLFKKAIDESSKLQNALIGVNSVANAFGISTDRITETAKGLAQDGLIPLQDITSSLKNLIVNFNGDLEKSVDVFNALKNSAAFNRQGQLSLGEAIRGASEGLKNDLSIKIDNAGVTKNLSILQKEYAASIGTSVAKLTDAQRAQAEYVGILKEASIFQGDYNKLINTFSGALSALGTAFNFFLVAIGDIVTRSPAIIVVLNAITTEIVELTNAINGIGSGGVKQFILAAITVGESINNYIIKPLGFVIDALQIVSNAVHTFAAGVSGAFGAIGGVIGSFLEKLGLDNPFTQFLNDFSEGSGQVFKESLVDLALSMDDLFGEGANDKLGTFFENLRMNVEATTPTLAKLSGSLKGVAGDAKKMATSGVNAAKAVNTAIGQALAKSASQGIQSLTKSLLLGEKGFDNFGKKIAGIVGSMAIQLGETLIFTGLGIEALKSLGGAAAIAAGVGLIALGTVLKSFSGGEGAGGGSIAGAGSSSGGGVDTFEDSPTVAQAEPEEPDTKVAITIQGDVFDSEESGLRIAQILESASLNQNVTVVGAA